MWPQPWRAVGAATGAQRCSMERIDLTCRLGPKTNMDAAFMRHRRHPGAQIDPEPGIALAEADRRRPRDEARQTKRRQCGLVEPRGAFEVADAEGDVVDHLNAPS